ncbi:pentapeptide repeat-containing protein [Sporosarcina sp. 179-K 8C2 HS]|uniref:pentapeptide repeat-containing protein n=1 Tax=Sporosarcina sp. 179-K 8C2 HS TaxID=3142387 RepID=UPI00399F9AA2
MAEKKDKRMKPKLSMEHELLRPSDIWMRERFIEQARFEGGVMTGADEERLVFDNCVFKDMSFANSDWRGVEFVDVLFQTCDFSNVQMENVMFHRCEIVNSKLTGADLANSNVGHLLVKDSDARYANFNFSEMKEVEFTDCNLMDSDFYECKFNQVRFEKCKLDNANFSETDLDGVDLSSSTYEHIEVTIPKIAGCIVSIEQALGFARALGLTVKEE